MDVKLGKRPRSSSGHATALLGLATALLVFFCSAQIARAATFNVNSTADAPDATNNNGICETGPGNGVCTLRAAFEEANAFAGSDTINVPAGHYVLPLGQLSLSQNATINGAGAAVTIISGVDTSRVVAIAPGSTTATIAGVTINHGYDSDFGGGISNGAGDTLTVANSIITGNTGGFFGGGIANSGTLTVTGSTISLNNANGIAGVGGGIQSNGPVTIVDSTISSNNANGNSGAGGGIFSNGTVSITNSTISSNKAPGGSAVGGGIFVNNDLTLTNATISSNAAGSLGGGVFANDVVTYNNTIVAGNSGGASPNCVHNSGIAAQHSLESADTCGFTTAGNQNSKDPLLGPLADNGGPTQTHALLAGSPAIDAGTNSGCPATDQRGGSRPQPPGGACDIGAFEFGGLADLVLSQTDIPDPIDAGSKLTYTVTATNNGPDEAAGIVVSDTLPAGVSVVSTTSSTGACTTNGSTVTCAIGTLAKGASAKVTLVITPAKSGGAVNIANVSGNPADPVPANNTASSETAVRVSVAGLGVQPRKFRARRSGASILSAAATGARVKYKLFEAASVKFTIERASKGRKVGRKCKKQTSKNRKRKRCTRYTRLKGSFTNKGKAGSNSFRFSGRLGGKKLRPGNYRLVAVATAGKSKSLPKRAPFKIVR